MTERTALPRDLDLPAPKLPALAPWPEHADARTAAIAALRAEASINKATGDVEIERIGRTCAERVQQYAPGAPQSTRDEAVIRFAAYIYFTTKSQGVVSESLGPQSITYATNTHADAFRRCGAAGLLSPWKRRTAGLV